MREMGWSWSEYQDTPLSVVEFIVNDMTERAKKAPGPR